MDNPKIIYLITALCVLCCFIFAAYSTGGHFGLTIMVGLFYILALYTFLALCLALKMVWQALLSSD